MSLQENDMSAPLRACREQTTWSDSMSGVTCVMGLGKTLEQHLGCPISSSIPLANLIDDRLWTRRKMAEVGMATPMTLGLMFKPTWRPPHQDEHAITFKDVTDKDISEVAHIDVVAFLTKLRANGFEKVVVKPSGPKFYGSIGVSIHPINDVEDIQRKTLSLLEEIEPANSVLIESFQETFAPVPTDKRPQWSADETLGFRIKVTVCRDFTNRPITSKITCVLGPKDSPINGDNGVSQTLDSSLIAFGVLDAYERRLLCANVCRQSEDVLQRIIDTEKHEFSENDLPPGAQTDLIGIDMVITRQNGVLTPVGIEVNSYDCTINCQISEFMSSLYRRLLPVQNMPTHSIELRNSSLEKDYVINDSRFLNIENLMEIKGEGSSVRPLVETMIYRSQQHEMRGNKVVVIGAGGYSKRKLWADAAKYGIEVTLIDSNKDHFAKDLVNRFIHYDLDDHKQDQTHAQNISNVLRDMNIHVDGCVTFWEDCVPLAARVCEILGLNGSTIAAARTAKKKSRTQLAVAANKEDIPHWPRPYLYSSNVHCLSDSESYDNRISRREFPAILKLEHGSSAVGVSLVKNNYELRKKFTEISETLQSESDYAGIGLGHDNSMFVSDYHEGSEHDVDLVMFGRRPIAAFISDNGPTRVPLFTETAAMMPSSLPLDKQAQLVTAAVQCCTEIGLSEGTFNVELKMTSTGPKLIEINARMGGFYLREWIYNLYGVDIMLSSFMVACDIQPFIPKRNPNKFRMGIMLLPSLHGKLLYDDSFKNWLWENQQKEDIMWTQFAETAQCEHDIHEEPIGNLSVEGRTPDEAKHQLLDICKKFDIERKDYCVHDFLKYF